MLKRLLYSVLLGLVGAAVVHLVIVLAVPQISERTAWNRLADSIEAYTFVSLVDRPDIAELIRVSDPLFGMATCHFKLSDGPIRLTTDTQAPFWSISIFDRGGINVFSFNDRNATTGLLDIVLATPAEATELKRDLPVELEQSFLVEAGIDEGYVVLRAFRPDTSWSGEIARLLRNAECGPI